jgi:ABC-type multidrug transport system ATPase subunit/ABC-type multidrug transport system permease subunit
VGDTPLLRDVSFAIPQGELVAILGPSGAGKSLLIELLCGAASPDAGHMEALARPPRELGGRLGYVPQGEIVHEALTVREALVATARLRAPELGAAPLLLETRIAQVVTRLGLAHRLEVRIGRLSGGERRRVSLAIELLTEPDLLILDEVTSGLDAASERQAMEILAGLANSGTTVVCTTHTLASADLFDRVLVLHGGRLVFDGQPDSAREHFAVERLDDLYGALAEETPETWVERRPAPAPVNPNATKLTERVALPGPPGLHQLATLVARQLKVTLRDGKSLAVLLGQALVIALLIAFAYDVGSTAGRVEVGFKLVLSALWLGCISTCQELVKERAIYARERLAGLSPHAYLGAKTLVMALLVLVQAAAFTAVIYACEPLSEPVTRVGGVLCLAALCGGGLGLLISASVGTRTAAVGLTPLVLVPQILFVGTLEPLQGFAASLGKAMPSHWANEAIRGVLLDGAPFPALDASVLTAFTATFLLGAWALLLLRGDRGRTP